MGRGEVFVATDDARVARAIQEAGLTAVMTPSMLRTGSDRVAWAYEWLQRQGWVNRRCRWVLNIQGDQPLLDPEDVRALTSATEFAPDDAELVTIVREACDQDFTERKIVKAFCRSDGRIVGFFRDLSRCALPSSGSVRVHVGLYAFREAALHRFARLPTDSSEDREGLEQLRALAAGMRIYAVARQGQREHLALDTPEDVGAVLRALRASTVR